jgi:hypothetical protein
MKTFWKIFFIALGLFVFLGGCVMVGKFALIVQFLGALILMVGLLPIIDKKTFSAFKEK